MRSIIKMEMEGEVLGVEEMPPVSVNENTAAQSNASESADHKDVTPQSEENDVQLPVLIDRNDSNIAQNFTIGRTEIPDSEAFSELSGLEIISTLSPPVTTDANTNHPDQVVSRAIESSNEDAELRSMVTMVAAASDGQAEVDCPAERVESEPGQGPTSSTLSLAAAAMKELQESDPTVSKNKLREASVVSSTIQDAISSIEEVQELPKVLVSDKATIRIDEDMEAADLTEPEHSDESTIVASDETEKQETEVGKASDDFQEDHPPDLHIARNLSNTSSLQAEEHMLRIKENSEGIGTKPELGQYTSQHEELNRCSSDQHYDRIPQVTGLAVIISENLNDLDVPPVPTPKDLMDGLEKGTTVEDEDTDTTNSGDLSQRHIEQAKKPVIASHGSLNKGSVMSLLSTAKTVMEDGLTIASTRENGDEAPSTSALNTYIDGIDCAVTSTFEVVVGELPVLPVLTQAPSPLHSGREYISREEAQMLNGDADLGEASGESFIRTMATSSAGAPPETHSAIQNGEIHTLVEGQPEEKEPVIESIPYSPKSSNDGGIASQAARDEQTDTSATIRTKDSGRVAPLGLTEDVPMTDAIKPDQLSASKNDPHAAADVDAQEESHPFQSAPQAEGKPVIPDSEDESMLDSSAPNLEHDDSETDNFMPSALALQAELVQEEAGVISTQINVLVEADVLESSQLASSDVVMTEASIPQQDRGTAEVQASVHYTKEAFVTASEEIEEPRKSRGRMVPDSDDENEADEEVEEIVTLPLTCYESLRSISKPMEDAKAPLAELVVNESKEAQIIETPSSSPKVEAVPSSQKKRPKTPNKSFKLPTFNKDKHSLSSGIQSSPAKSEVSNSSPSKPTQVLEASESSQNDDPVMRELIAMKIASIKTRNAALTADIETKRAKMVEISKDLTQPAAETVKTHIKLLHDYNDIKDVGQGLIGMIADSRGVRIGELYEEFGVDLKD